MLLIDAMCIIYVVEEIGPYADLFRLDGRQVALSSLLPDGRHVPSGCPADEVQ